MNSLVGHASRELVRRAATQKHGDGDGDKKWSLDLSEISGPAWATLALTAITGLVVYGLVSYTLALIFKLAAIENTDQAFLIPTAKPQAAPPAYKDIDSPSADETAPLAGASTDPEILLVTQKPITSSIRSTVHHLHSIGGFRARWRGFWMGFTWLFCFFLLDSLFGFIFGLIGLAIISSLITPVLARIAMARWEMGWTWIMISKPSSDPWYRRTPPTKTWNNVWAATGLNHLVCVVATLAPIGGGYLLGMHTKLQAEYEDKPPTRGDTFSLLGLFSLYIVCYYALIIPAEVALTRVQASMLPPEEEAIVPFDRTFGGRVVAQEDGSTRALGFFDAWQSFSKEGRIRVVKLVLKTMAIELGVAILFGLIFGLELCFFVLPAFTPDKGHPDDLRV